MEFCAFFLQPTLLKGWKKRFARCQKGNLFYYEVMYPIFLHMSCVKLWPIIRQCLLFLSFSSRGRDSCFGQRWSPYALYVTRGFSSYLFSVHLSFSFIHFFWCSCTGLIVAKEIIIACEKVAPKIRPVHELYEIWKKKIGIIITQSRHQGKYAWLPVLGRWRI